MYVDYIQTALLGAKFHEDQAFLLAYPERPRYMEVVFHLRAYFWELWSIWDYILQHANKQTLDLDPYLVRRGFLKKYENELSSYLYLSLLKSIEGDDWLIEIRSLRDHAHKWQLDPSLVEFNDEIVSVIALNNLDEKDKNLPRQISVDRNHLWFMSESVRKLSSEGFFDPVLKSNNKS